MILMYHKVDLHAPTVWWVDVDTFWRQMEQLTRYDVVPLSGYDPGNPGHVVITFDGVYENVYRYALPVLRRFGYPFELFVVGELIGKDNGFDRAVEPPAMFADRDQLLACVGHGGRLQWHTRTHGSLAELSDGELARELSVPEEIRGLDPDGFRWFAYPHGSVEPRAAEQVRQRFVGALACDEGNAADRMRLPRVTVTNDASFARSTVSLIIPSYNYGRFAADAIESALAQTVPPKEILFIDDGSRDNSLEVAGRYKDRIRIVGNERNLGIVENFNKAASLTTGDYICFLGADNRFRADYVERCQRLLDRNAGVGIVYTDMLLFGPRAEILALRVGAQALPDSERAFAWRCPEFDEGSAKRLATSNFIHGSSMYRREAFLQAGGYLDGSMPEDHNLFLRMIEKGWKALRCPELLLEYRQHSAEQANTQLGSGLELAHARQEIKALVEENLRLKAALNGIHASFGWEVLETCRRMKARLAPEESFRRTLYLWMVHAVRLARDEGGKALLRKGARKLARIMRPPATTVKVRTAFEASENVTGGDMPFVDVVIVTWNSSGCIRQCLDDVLRSDYPADRVGVRVVDNDSKDDTVSIVEGMVRMFPALAIVRNAGNVGFGRGVNLGVGGSRARYVLLLNPDVQLRSDTLRHLVESARAGEARGGCAWEARQRPYEHPKIYDPVTLETEWVSGACCLLLREAFDKVGGFDPRIFLYAEDVDLSWRLRARGYHLYYVPGAEVVHDTYSDPDVVKPAQYIHSVISNGILRHKHGTFGDIATWYLRFAGLLAGRQAFPSARSGLANAGIAACPTIARTVVKRCFTASTHRVAPRFDGWNYEVRRTGAFYRIRSRSGSPLVSVIVRTMERPHYLREALQSLRNQTYKNLEVIVVDDGTLKSRGIVREFDDLVSRYLDPDERMGRCRAGNAGLAGATGRYVNFLDEDDLLFADHVEALVGELEGSGRCRAAYSVGFQVETEVLSLDPFRYEEGEYETRHCQPFDRNLLRERNYIPINCMMFDRDLYRECGGFDEKLALLEDWDLWNRYAERTDFLFIPKTTCLYRVPRNLDRVAVRQQGLDEAYRVVTGKSSANRLPGA